jgi:hypothetical protein
MGRREGVVVGILLRIQKLPLRELLKSDDTRA